MHFAQRRCAQLGRALRGHLLPGYCMGGHDLDVPKTVIPKTWFFLSVKNVNIWCLLRKKHQFFPVAVSFYSKSKKTPDWKFNDNPATLIPLEPSVSSHEQCCGAVTIGFGSGSGSDFQHVLAPAPTITDSILKWIFHVFYERILT